MADFEVKEENIVRPLEMKANNNINNNINNRINNNSKSNVNNDFISDFEESFKEWLDIVNKDNINGDIKILTRMYWEFRMGCWLSTNEQACDIMDNVTNIHIFNCRRNLELLWELNETTRHTRDWERTIVNELCPQLSKIPYDREYTNMRLKFYHAYVKLVGWLKIHIPISLYKRLKFIMNHIINTNWIN